MDDPLGALKLRVDDPPLGAPKLRVDDPPLVGIPGAGAAPPWAPPAPVGEMPKSRKTLSLSAFG